MSDALETPLLTGEDIYLLKNFKPLIDIHAVDIIHPDLATSGGLLETKRIGDYAEEHGYCNGNASGRYTCFIYGKCSLCCSHTKLSCTVNITLLMFHGGKVWLK